MNNDNRCLHALVSSDVTRNTFTIKQWPNPTDPSLVTIDSQLRFLPITFFVCILNLLIWHTRGNASYYVRAMALMHSCGYS